MLFKLNFFFGTYEIFQIFESFIIFSFNEAAS